MRVASKNKLFSDRHIKPLLISFYELESGVIGKQRATVFSYSSALLIGGVILNLFGLAGPVALFYKVANSAQAILTLLALYLYYSRRISLATAMSFFCIVLQVELSAETIYCAINKSTYDMALILANISLSSIVLLLSVIAYLRVIPIVIATLSLTTYGISIYMTGNEVLGSFFMVFFIVFLALTLLGYSMIENIVRLDGENSVLKDKKQEILNVFQLTEHEMNSYMSLARDKGIKPEQTAEILTAVGTVAERRILDNVALYVRQSSIEFDKLRERLPELSPSELEICALILKEKKLKEIIEILGKSRSNITCQRTNIRAKLAMQPKDNLLEVLKKRMESLE